MTTLQKIDVAKNEWLQIKDKQVKSISWYYITQDRSKLDMRKIEDNSYFQYFGIFSFLSNMYQ